MGKRLLLLILVIGNDLNRADFSAQGSPTGLENDKPRWIYLTLII